MLGEVLTAILTPFHPDGSVNVGKFRELAGYLVHNGSDGLVVAGTTGESPTLSDDEKLMLFEAAVETVGDRATVVAGQRRHPAGRRRNAGGEIMKKQGYQVIGTRPLRHFVQLFHENRPGLAQLVHDVLVVYDFLSNINRRAVQIQRDFDDIDGSHNTGAETSRLEQENFLVRAVIRCERF